MRRILGAMVCALALGGAARAADSACSSLTPALIGGPVPVAASDTLVLRWLGTSNYEAAYKGKVFLFDTFYERPGRTRPIGFAVDQVKRADVIFIGHAHYDHISDISAVARQTGALVVGAPITIATAIKLGVPEEQTKAVVDGDELSFGPVKVLVALGRHSTIQDGLTAAHRQMYEIDELGPLTPEQTARAKEIAAKGTFVPDVIDKGTMGFAMVLPSGFSVVVFDTAGKVVFDGSGAVPLEAINRAISDATGIPLGPQAGSASTLSFNELNSEVVSSRP